MARNFNGGTDSIYYVDPSAHPVTGCIAFWIKTSQVTTNTSVITYWNSSSRNGWGILLNNTANKISAHGYAAVSNPVILTSTTSVNNGSAHHFAFNFNRNNGGSNQIYIDGVQEASVNSSAAWNPGTSGFFLQAGDNADAFWATLVGDLWEVGHWTRQLTADEIVALSKGFAPPRVAPDVLRHYTPWVRDTHEPRGGVSANVTGTTVVPHGRMMGGLV